MSAMNAQVRAPVDLLTNALYVGAGLLLAYALLAWLVARPVFALHHLDVRGDFKHVDEAQIRLLTSRNLRGNFFTVDLDKTRREFEKLVWVKEARVTRKWPDRLVTELKEHEPLAVWNGKQLVSTTGEVFNATLNQPLPSLSGMDDAGREVAEVYRKFSATLAPLGLTITELSLSSRRAWRMKTISGQAQAGLEIAPSPEIVSLEIAPRLEIVLGRKDAEARLSRFAGQYDKLVAQLGAAPTYVDLRYADGFALKRAVPVPAQAMAANLNGRSQL